MSSNRERIESIRERLKMKDLSEGEKKALFQRFVEAGGEVIDLDAEERRALKKAVRTVEREQARIQRDGKEAEKKRSDVMKKAEEQNPVSQWIELTASRITCALLGMVRWNGRQLKENFVNFLLYDFQNTLLQIRMILASLLYQDKAITAEVRQMMLADPSFPFGYELIYRLDNLYQEEYFHFLAEHKLSPDSFFETLDVLKAMYRSLFVIQNYQTSLKLALEKALRKEGEIRRLNSRITDQNIKSLSLAVDFVYERVINRFYPLMEYAYRLERQKKRMSFRDFLEMKPEDVLGYYTDQWREEMKKAVQEEAKKAQSSQASEASLFPLTEEVANHVLQGLSEYVQKGVAFIDERIHWKEKLMEYESNRSPRSVYTVNDKIFLVETLVELYESEFSFLFTSNKVQYNYLLIDGKRVDIKKELLDLYYRMMPLRDRFNEYLRILKEIRAVEKEAFLSVAEKSSRLNQFAIQRSQISRQIRRDLREMFEQYSNKWLFVLSRAESEMPVIQNMQDTLSFDRKLEGDRWAHGRTIREAVEMAYSLADTIHFLLMGELGGTSLLIEKSLYLKI
ncbi:MAG: hypothetical protein N2314_08705 [Brevinematales bacterium]|nr:hypothetical protein [Brevinematales bacterium]